MVLESMLTPLKAEKHPWEMLFYGIIVSSIAIFLSYWVFRDAADLVAIFLTVFACVPIMFHAIRSEEKKDIKIKNEMRLLKEHSKVIGFFIFLFLGMVISFAMWYVFLPTEMTNILFNQQTATINQINNITGNAVNYNFFTRVFFNNMKVLAFSILFSFFYGAGAIFILTWNASVVAVAIGSMIKSLLIHNNIIFSSGLAFSRYLIHGLPEMTAYMIGGLAGGIISAAIINKHFKTEQLERVIFDASILFSIAIIILFLSAILEGFIVGIF